MLSPATTIGLFVLLLAPIAGMQGGEAVYFNTFQRMTNREIALGLVAPNGFAYRVSAATNLPDWTTLTTLAGTNGSLQHTDSAAPYLSQRFYRAEQLTGTNFLTGDHLATTNGEVVFHTINHATLILTWQGKTIYCDPVPAAGPYTSFPKADLMLVTHTHSDHFSAATLASVRNTVAAIIAPKAVYNDSSMTSLRPITGILPTACPPISWGCQSRPSRHITLPTTTTPKALVTATS